MNGNYHPTKNEFIELARCFNLIPVWATLLADYETPLSAYTKLRNPGGSFLLESVEGGEHLGRYSFVGCNPRAIIRQIGNKVEVIENAQLLRSYNVTPIKVPAWEKTSRQLNSTTIADGLVALEQYMGQFRMAPVPNLPRFTGGAVGYLGYEFIHDIEPVVPRPPLDKLNTPTMYFLVTDQLVVFDRVKQNITVLINAFVPDPSSAAKIYDYSVNALEKIIHTLQKECPIPVTLMPKDIPEIEFESNTPKENFIANVLRVKELIRAGDVIQVVGSQRFRAPVTASPLDVYRALRTINPSPYLFILELEDFALVGASPEIHVRCEDGRTEIRPIAGTRPRGKTPEEDLHLERALLADPKERAEHIMLVDLARNDLGRVCTYGSVKVRELMIIERYSHVMHIVSSVEGKLDPKYSVYDLMRATFPAGTLTGAPKIRAMQIISEIERTTRGPYGGCVGYFSFTGNLDTCITIRTVLIKDGYAYIQAGGGWVIDSDPELEYQETINKARAGFKAVALAQALHNQHP